MQVGNFVIDVYFDNLGVIDFYYFYNFIFDEIYYKLKENCDFVFDFLVDYFFYNVICLNIFSYVFDVVMREINIYNIYGLYCNLFVKLGCF